jgi:hypothetical protein
MWTGSLVRGEPEPSAQRYILNRIEHLSLALRMFAPEPPMGVILRTIRQWL